MTKTGIPIFFWLIVPVALILGQIVLEMSFDSGTLARLHSEGGPHEILQSVYIGAAFLLSLWMLVKIDWKRQRLIGGAVLLAALGSFYISGEEISWGQHLLHWNTPEYWAQYNDQNETNLHNTSGWLDQKPRLLLFVGIVVAGLLVPALRRWAPSRLPEKFADLYPSNILIPTALGVAGPYLVQEIGEHLHDRHIFERVSEVQEGYMYYFVALYLWDLYLRKIAPPRLVS